jgi:hypothetical protein
MGFWLGWYLHYRNQSQTHSEAYDIASRLFMLWFGVFGWAIGTVARLSKLYCGGRERLKSFRWLYVGRIFACG